MANLIPIAGDNAVAVLLVIFMQFRVALKVELRVVAV
jgi:hypothetical protein